jgi:NAD(P)-dependent dehydrogenase (short-subunit alcohol dehydrogenase family)
VGLNLEGRSCIVTGASTGIGLAIAIELVREGANVVLAARRSGPLEEAAQLARSSGSGNAIAVPADTSDSEAVHHLAAATAEQFGAVDVLVNNAAVAGGRARPAQATAVDLAGVADDFAEKVLGYLRCAQAVAPYMIAQRFGRIINVAGTAARTTGVVSSSIRQASVSALSKNLADELGPFGITTTTLHPGPTRTARVDERMRADDSLREQFEGASSLRRIIEPEEVGWVVAFLASPKSIAINGETITCGGGIRGFIDY